MQADEQIIAFLSRLAEVDGHPPLSEAKRLVLDDPGRRIVVTERDEVVAVGACAAHPQADGTTRYAVETAVERSMRFRQFEGAVLDAACELVPDRSHASVWSDRSTLDDALDERGFVVVRTLAFMTAPLNVIEVEAPREFTVRSFTPRDVEAVVEVNRLAFSGHREAGALDEDELRGYMSQPWFDPAGFLLVESGDELVGFCWTRVHDDGDGEIYRIAVAPRHGGRGAGRRALGAGFGYLASRPDVRRGVLWVDTANERAVGMYRAAGLRIEREIREFEPPG